MAQIVWLIDIYYMKKPVISCKIKNKELKLFIVKPVDDKNKEIKKW